MLHSDYTITARLLDRQRLGKQRVEAKQIISALTGGTGYAKHPATLMWVGYVESLKLYFNTMCTEWMSRGYKNTMPLYEIDGTPPAPCWIGWKQVHYSHMASLMRKDPQYYYTRFIYPHGYNHVGYLWPTHLSQEQIYAINSGAELPLTTICDPISKDALVKAAEHGDFLAAVYAHHEKVSSDATPVASAT